VGRPSKYQAAFAEQARKLCLLGATDKELADFFGVAESTLNLWKQDHKEFSESLKAGKDQADAEVAEKLFRRALGYSHDAVKIVADAKSKEEHIVHFTEHYPPDTTAAIFWLKNRQKAKWRDGQSVEHTGKDGGPIQSENKLDLSGLTTEQLRALASIPLNS
jgi:transposase-like protein